MENQNQNYAPYERDGVEEKTNVNGDPSETIDGNELKPGIDDVGTADVDSLLEEIDDKDASGPDPDDDDDLEENDGLDDDDGLDGDGLDEDSEDDDLPVEPEEDDLNLDEEEIDGNKEEEEDEFLNATQHS